MKKLLLATMIIGINVQAETNSTLLFDGGINALLVDKKSFYVTVSDQVTGGCLPKPNQLKKKMELALKNNGFKVLDKSEPMSSEIYITALGFRKNSMCSVALDVDMWFPVVVNVPNSSKVQEGHETYVNYSYNIGYHILHYKPSQIQSQLNKTVKKHGDTIYLKISKAKDDIFAKFPSIQEEIKKDK